MKESEKSEKYEASGCALPPPAVHLQHPPPPGLGSAL